MAAQAGWYVDPRDARQYRYWDGDRWSQSTQPIPEFADAANVNGGASGSLSAGGAKDPVGADAFDQAPGQPTASEDGVLADFMWTSGFGETPDDPTANAGPAMFTPGATASAPPAPAAAVPPAPAPVPAAPSAPVPAPAIPPAATAPAAPSHEPVEPLFQPPAAVADSGFGAPNAAPAPPQADPEAGAPLFSPPGTGGGLPFGSPPSVAPAAFGAFDLTADEHGANGAHASTTPAGSDASAPVFEPAVAPPVPAPPFGGAASLFAPIDPSLQPIFGAGDQVGSPRPEPAKRGRKGRGKPAPAAAPSPAPPAPVLLSAPEPFRMPEPDLFVPAPDIAVEPDAAPAGVVKIKMDRKSDRKTKSPKGGPQAKGQKGNDQPKSKVPILLAGLAVVVLGAGAFLLLSGGDDEADTAADVAGTTVEKTSTTVAPTTTAAAVATTVAPTATTAAPVATTASPTADPAAIAGLQAAFDAEATRACDVIKADPGILTEDVIQYDPAWATIPRTYQDLQKNVNDCTFQARDEALKRVAALDAANNGG